MYDVKEHKKGKEKAILVGVIFPGSHSASIEEQLNELALLADTAGAEIIDHVTQKRHKIDAATFIGKGKLERILEQAEMLSCNLIIFNDEINPNQIKNIQNIAGENIKILDRTGLILDIFSKHARTKESKTQIELARLQYLLPRLTRAWTHLERQIGGIGMRGGPGETQIEIDRRLIRNQISKLKKDLLKIEKQQGTQSANRNSEYRVALVGYTNAGKSTLMRALTGADVYVQDQLFATLDTTVRKLDLGNNQKILLSDTVGFIRKLPHDLVASFRTTLAEARDANLLIKVLDASSEYLEDHLDTIQNVLKSLKLDEINSIIVLNKIDLVKDSGLYRGLKSKYPNSIIISAHKKLKLEDLTEAIINEMTKTQIYYKLEIPYDKTQVLDAIYNMLIVKQRKDEDEFIKLDVQGKKSDIDMILSRIKK
jgi:GTPase